MTRSESTGITPDTRLARCVAATGRRREPLRTARIACRVAALTVALLALPAAHAQTLTGTGLNSLGTYFAYWGGMSINNAGQVAFTAETSYQRAFLYTPGVGVTQLPTLGGNTAYATSINDLGQVVGYGDSQVPRAGNGFNGSPQAFVYSAGTMTNLGGSLGGTTSWAYDINNSGQVVGAVYNSAAHPFAQRAYLYGTGGSTATDLGTFGGNNGQAGAINNLGSISGMAEDFNSQNQSSTYRLFTFAGGAMANLGINPSLGIGSRGVYDMNDAGQVVGNFSVSTSFGGRIHAFLATGGMVTDLGTPIGQESRNVTPYGINASGWVVGATTTSNGGSPLPFLYANGAMHSLNSLAAPLLSDGNTAGFTSLQYASDINDQGQITGYGTYLFGDGSVRTYMPYVLSISAVPEPSSLLMLAGGLIVVSLVRRRRGR